MQAGAVGHSRSQSVRWADEEPEGQSGFRIGGSQQVSLHPSRQQHMRSCLKCNRTFVSPSNMQLTLGQCFSTIQNQKLTAGQPAFMRQHLVYSYLKCTCSSNRTFASPSNMQLTAGQPALRSRQNYLLSHMQPALTSRLHWHQLYQYCREAPPHEHIDLHEQ